MMLIKGKKYATKDPGRIPLRVHLALQEEFGFDWTAVTEFWANTPDGTPLGHVIGKREFHAFIYAWMLTADPAVTRDDVTNLTLNDIEFRDDTAKTAAEAREEVPTSAPTDSDRGDVAALPKRAPSTRKPSQTSRRRSISA